MFLGRTGRDQTLAGARLTGPGAIAWGFGGRNTRLALQATVAYCSHVAQVNPAIEDDPLRHESDTERVVRVRREAERIAQAKAEYAAGLVIEDEDFEAWLDALDIDENAPPPQPRSTSQKYPL